MGFHGSAREHRTFRRLLRLNTPPARQRDRYAGIAAVFVAALRRGGRNARLHGVSLRRSRLYEGEYPCLFLPDATFPSPALDAFCTRRWSDGFPFPVVCLRASMTRRRSRAFQSIVEHEMTHANQALCGRFPDGRASTTVAAATAAVFALARAEFEAYFLQLGRWPELIPDSRGYRTTFTLFSWSFARAWVDALELLLEGELCAAPLVPAVLAALHRDMAAFLGDLDASRADADWFTGDQVRLVQSIAKGPGATPAHQAEALRWVAQRQ
jgi:hypothetical protein